MKLLSERRVSEKEATEFIRFVMATEGTPLAGNVNGRSMKKVKMLFDGQGKGAEMSSSKQTAFGLLNSVTQYVDHERRAKSNGHRLDSAWFGAGAALKQKAFRATSALL